MEYTWDLSVLYHGFDDPQIERDAEALSAIPKAASALLSSGLSYTETLEKVCGMLEEAATVISRLGSFAQLTLSADAKNEEAAKLFNRVMLLGVDQELLNSELTRYVGGIEDLEAVISSSKKLTELAFVLRKTKESAEHLIDEKVEPWILKMSLTGGEAFSQLRDMLDATLLIDFRGEKLPLSAVRGKAYDADAAVRKEAYEAEIAAYKQIEIPMAACLNSIKGESQTVADASNYESILSKTLIQNKMKKETLDAMFTAIDESLPKFRAYLRKKGELLGHQNGIPFYDLFAPMSVPGYQPRKFTVEEAKAKLVEEMSKFSKDMGAFIARAFDARWIDFFPREGKVGGAFCAELHEKKQSRVLTNFDGTISDISTLAHELGHAWHNVQLDPLSPLLINTPMPLAETASIFNETLLAHAAREKAGKAESFALLEGGLMENTQVIVDIYSRYLFETAVIDGRKDHALSVNELKAAMLKAQAETYGDGLDPDVRHPYMWACKSHYYSPGYAFYNFPYAFGLLFGLGMFAQYQQKGAEFVPSYNRILSLCGSMDIEDVAAEAGIDVTTPEFWRSSLQVIEGDIDEFMRLADELY